MILFRLDGGIIIYLDINFLFFNLCNVDIHRLDFCVLLCHKANLIAFSFHQTNWCTTPTTLAAVALSIIVCSHIYICSHAWASLLLSFYSNTARYKCTKFGQYWWRWLQKMHRHQLCTECVRAIFSACWPMSISLDAWKNSSGPRSAPLRNKSSGEDCNSHVTKREKAPH